MFVHLYVLIYISSAELLFLFIPTLQIFQFLSLHIAKF